MHQEWHSNYKTWHAKIISQVHAMAMIKFN